MCALRSLIKLDFAGRRFTSQHVKLMTKRQDLYLQPRSRPEQSDHRQPNQAANISHQPRASPDSTSLASRIEFPTMTELRLDWSPEQIAGWLKRTHPEDGCNQVSHETIYRSLFVQTRGVLKKELLSHLRSKRSMRRSQPVDPNGDRRGHIKDIVSIRQRPAAVEDRAVPGHWCGSAWRLIPH